MEVLGDGIGEGSSQDALNVLFIYFVMHPTVLYSAGSVSKEGFGRAGVGRVCLWLRGDTSKMYCVRATIFYATMSQ